MSDPIWISDPLTLRKSEWLEDWYVIERAEHEGREWLVPTEHGVSLRRSARISDADVEGTAAEMRAIADAIEKRGEYAVKRCAVRVDEGRAYLWSPRNSIQRARVSLPMADALAKTIRETLGSE